MPPSKQLLFIPGPGFGSHEEARVLGPRLEASGWATLFWNDPPHTEAGQNSECSFEQYIDSLDHAVRTVGGNDLTLACHSAAIHPTLAVLRRTSVTPKRIVLIAPACDLTDAFRRVLGLAASDLDASHPDASQRLKVLIAKTQHFADAAMREGLQLAATDPLLFTHYWRDQVGLAAFAKAAHFADGQFRPDVFFAVLDGLSRETSAPMWRKNISAVALFATADPVIDVEVSLRAGRTLFPRLDVEAFADTGHWLHLERPDAFVAVLMREDRPAAISSGAEARRDETTMSTNATLAKRWFKEVWVHDGERTVHELMAEHVRGYMEGDVEIHGREEFLAARRKFLETFPDLSLAVDDVIAEGTKVVVRWRAKASHKNDAQGAPASAVPVSFRGLTWLEFENGKIVLGWDSWNLGGLMQSLNVVSGA